MLDAGIPANFFIQGHNLQKEVGPSISVQLFALKIKGVPAKKDSQPDPGGFKLLSPAWWWRGNWQIGHISTPIEGGFYMSCHKVSDFVAYYKLFGVDY